MTHLQTFSTFFLDLKVCLTDFRQNGSHEFPWAVGGRTAGFYIKKVKKELTGPPFLDTFFLTLLLYTLAFTQISWILIEELRHSGLNSMILKVV